MSDGAWASHGLDLSLSLSYVAFARHETMSVLVTLIDEDGEIHLDLDLGLQGRGGHRPSKLRARSRPGQSALPQRPRRCSLRFNVGVPSSPAR